MFGPQRGISHPAHGHRPTVLHGLGLAAIQGRGAVGARANCRLLLGVQPRADGPFCPSSHGDGITLVEWQQEIAGGMNFKRKGVPFADGPHGTQRNSQAAAFHADRLLRFGCDWFKYFAERHGCEITLVNQECLSPKQEMTEVLMAIVNKFTSRLDGSATFPAGNP